MSAELAVQTTSKNLTRSLSFGRHLASNRDQPQVQTKNPRERASPLTPPLDLGSGKATGASNSERSLRAYWSGRKAETLGPAPCMYSFAAWLRRPSCSARQRSLLFERGHTLDHCAGRSCWQRRGLVQCKGTCPKLTSGSVLGVTCPAAMFIINADRGSAT